MKCLVTGATGFLGTNLVHELLKSGWKVRILARPDSNTTYIKSPPVETVRGDVTRNEEVDNAVQGMDVVFHVAGDTSFWKNHFHRQRRTNVEGPVNVAKACIRHGIKRLVHTSTIDALGYNPTGLTDERWTDYNYRKTGYNYADTKREGEKRVMAFNSRDLEVVVIYPGSMIGPYDFTLQFGRLFFDLRDNKIPGCPPGGIGFGHVTEVARAHIAAAVKGTAGEGYICAGVNTTYRELFETIAAKFSMHAPKWDIPRRLFVAYGFFSELFSTFTGKPPYVNPGQARFMSVKAYYDSAKAVKELEYRIVPLSKMVDDAYDWYKTNGFL